MFSRILVPLDGSQLSERALPHAVQMAQIFDGRLVLLHVLEADPNAGLIDPLSWQIKKAEADLYLREKVMALAESGLEVEHQILEGRTPEAIVQFAQSNAVDLVVISSHGRGGLSRWDVSSVAAKVVEKIYLPLLLVRAYHPVSGEVASGPYRKLLVPVDNSKRAECALPVAITIATTSAAGATTGKAGAVPDQAPAASGPMDAAASTASTASTSEATSSGAATSAGAAASAGEASAPTGEVAPAEIILAHILRRPEVPQDVPETAELTRLAGEYITLARAASETYLEQLRARVPGPCTTRILEGDSVTRGLHELANAEDVDLVVVCAHGQGGPSDWPYGTVARHYIEHGAHTVLVMQDIPPSLAKPTPVEQAASQQGGRG